MDRSRLSPAFFYVQKKQLITEADARTLELASEKGVSCWRTSLPLKVFGFAMNKQEFHDAITLRYNFKISSVSGHCFCGQKNTINPGMDPAGKF